MILSQTPFEQHSLSPGQYDLVFYFLVIAGLALFASFLYSWTTRSEISPRYRTAVLASMCITAVAAVSYLVLIIKWDTGYALQGGRYVPGPEARFVIAPRYMDWSITVPLLTVELIAVSTLSGALARRTRFTSMAAAFLMILTGFLGAQVIKDGTSTGWLLLWGLISTAFFVYLYVVLIGATLTSLRALPAETGNSLLNATVLLLATFGVYPLVYAIPVFFHTTAGWLVTAQVAFSVADIAAKAGFGALIHKVAKLRTAQDLDQASATHSEAVFISGEQRSVALLPPNAVTNELVDYTAPRGDADLQQAIHRSW